MVEVSVVDVDVEVDVSVGEVEVEVEVVVESSLDTDVEDAAVGVASGGVVVVDDSSVASAVVVVSLACTVIVTSPSVAVLDGCKELVRVAGPNVSLVALTLQRTLATYIHPNQSNY